MTADATSSFAVDECAAEWWVKYSRGLSEAEQQALSAWLAMHEAHRRAFEAFRALDAGLQDIPDTQQRRLVAQARAGLDRHSTLTRLACAAQTWLSLPRLATACSVLLIVVASAVATDHYLQQPLSVQSFVTAKGAHATRLLADGSSIMLDTDTAVEVKLYRQHREVTLTHGQAMFSVHRDTARPFRVKAGPALVTVLGTEFSVRYTDDKVRVQVQQGHVRVEGSVELAPGDAAYDRHIELMAEQQVEVLANGLIANFSHIAQQDIAPWRNGRIIFDNTLLADAIAEFSRYQHTHIQLSEQARQLRVSGSFKAGKLTSFLNALPAVQPVRIDSDATVTRISLR